METGDIQFQVDTLKRRCADKYTIQMTKKFANQWSNSLRSVCVKLWDSTWQFREQAVRRPFGWMAQADRRCRLRQIYRITINEADSLFKEDPLFSSLKAEFCRLKNELGMGVKAACFQLMNTTEYRYYMGWCGIDKVISTFKGFADKKMRHVDYDFVRRCYTVFCVRETALCQIIHDIVGLHVIDTLTAMRLPQG